MNEVRSIPVPIALKELIISNNELLKKYQQELTSKVLLANEEIMRMLSLDASEGWRLDIGTYSYIKSESTDDTSVS